MDIPKDYTIHFVGLSIGNHHFDFEIDDSFFEQFEYSQLLHGNFDVGVELDKQERMMIFSFTFLGKAEVTCDRCGEDFMLPLEGHERLIVKFGNEYQEESDDMITIPSTEYQIDLAPLFYEYLHLMLPVKIVHPDDAEGKSGCNADTLRKLEELSPHSSPDPRWAALGNLQTNRDEEQGTGTPTQIKKKK